MIAKLRKIPRRAWIKIWIIYIVFVTLFLGGLMGFLKIFTLLPYPSDPAVEKNMNGVYNSQQDFPKILHHSWKNTVIPPMWQESYNACLSLNQGYTFMLWTDEKIEQFMDEYYPWFKKDFNSYIYKIQKIDVFRYFILYHFGGVYIDLDIQCKYPFSDILQNITKDHGMLLPGTWPIGVSNEFIVAKQYHPFLKFLISKLKYSHHEYGAHYFTILASTGPMFVSRCLQLYPDKDDIYELPMRVHKWQYFKHIDGDSWQWWDMWIINWWVSWVIFAVINFFIITFFVVKCCGYGSNGQVYKSNGHGPKYHRLGDDLKNGHKHSHSF